MKKLLAMVLVLGMASTVFGAAVEFRIDGAPSTGITLRASDTAEIQIWATDLTTGFFDAVMGLNTNPAQVDDFTFETALAGPNMYGSTFTPQPGPDVQLNDFAFTVYAYPYITAPGSQLLATLVIHCTGIPSVTVLTIDDLGGLAAMSDGTGAFYPTVDFATASITITQIPEPASLALLALGGLALIRRR